MSYAHIRTQQASRNFWQLDISVRQSICWGHSIPAIPGINPLAVTVKYVELMSVYDYGRFIT